MVRILALGLLLLPAMAGSAQRFLTLDSCRAMALRNNKQISVAMMNQEMSAYKRHSARTGYLPKVNFMGTYQYLSKSPSLLNDDQRAALPQMGTAVAASLKEKTAGALSQLPPQTIQALSQMGLTPEVIAGVNGIGADRLASALNGMGQGLVDVLDLNLHSVWAGAITVTQPVYMGGAIKTANKMADINEELAANSLELKRQNTLFNIDHAYWQVVSLRHKQTLAESYVALVKKLKDDIQKMINQGVATKGDGLSVSVRVNEAEMALTEVTDGLELSKMLLCQLCGLPLGEKITLADEERLQTGAPAGIRNSLATNQSTYNAMNYSNRPELKLLQNTIDLSEQTTNLLKAGNLPQVMLTGSYSLTNPNTFNGFEKKFGGMFNVGVLVRVPVWNWGDVKYKVRASKVATTIARMEMDETRELIELQVNQSNFKMDEALKKLEMANANVASAEENLRMANLGFKEGTVSHTTVMEAQTAWQQAQTKKIDAEINVKLSEVELQKALGTLR